jgi:hypothetical protein
MDAGRLGLGRFLTEGDFTEYDKKRLQGVA